MEILAVLKRYYVVILLSTCLAFILMMHLKLQHTRTQLELARSQVIILQTQINQQNAAVEHWKAENDLQVNQTKTALQESQEYRVVYHQDANKMLTNTVSTDCNAAITWAVRMAKQLSNQ